MFGDYGATALFPNGEAVKAPIFFERKNLSDLFGTLTSKKRIQRLMERLREAKEVGAKMILAVEATDAEVLAGTPFSQVPGMTVMKTITTMWFKYDLVPMFCASREVMAWRMMNIWGTWEKLR